MNDVALTGRLTSNPIIYENEDPKKQAAHFFLAVKKLGKRQEGEDTSFIPCVVFGKRGEHIHKGMLIGITGWIETSRREKEDGTMEYPWEVIVREMDFLEPKKNSENQNSTDGYNNYQEGQNNYQSGNNPYQDYNDNPYATAYDDRYNSGNQSAFDGNDQFNQGM